MPTIPEDPGFGNRFLKDIGKLPGINKYNDPNGAFGKYKRNLMRVVDLIPVYFTLDITNIFDNDVAKMQEPIKLDFDRGIREYQQKLYTVELEAFSGVRAWVTNETSSQDEIQNNYKENKIVEAYNSMIDTTSKARDPYKSIGGGSNPGTGIVNPISAAIIDGRHLSLPRIWEKSDYNPSLSLTVKLNSPYGNDQSFIRNIAKPLLYITALVSPSSYDGITYGLPPYIMVRAYGVSYMTLATADSISITRGGSDVRMNAVKQPLELAVSMSFKPAMPGFGAMVHPVYGTPADDIARINDVSDPVGDEDVRQFKRVPGITTLGSIIESLRPVSKAASAFPITLNSLPQAKVSVDTEPQPNLAQRSAPTIRIDSDIRQALYDVGVTLPNVSDAKIQSTV